MIDLITKAAENFFTHQINLSCTVTDGQTKMRTVIASIDIESEDHSSYRVYIAYSKGILQTITNLFLGEDANDTETLNDMALETVNQIVGSAKVLAARERDIHFNIAIPNLEHRDISDIGCEQTRLIRIDDQEVMIAIKEQ